MYAYLIKVEAGANNNKYYEMIDNEDGTFTAKWGRVGRNPQEKIYPTSAWDRIYRQKLGPRKGYTDVTHTVAVSSDTTTNSGDRIVSDSRIIKDIFQFLLSSTSQSVSTNYLVPVQGVTQAMIDDAQSAINRLVGLSVSEDWSDFNRTLQDLFTVIPRKMDRVADHLLIEVGSRDKTLEAAQRIISDEEDNLDSLRGQVVVSATDDKDEQQSSLFDRLGIVVEDVDNQEKALIIKQLGDISNEFYSAVKVTNKNTLARYREWIAQQQNSTEMLLWHGSRNQNWVSLLQRGLLIRPSGAITTGTMFGEGIYFAPRAKKSRGYTSLSGSYWTHGTSRRGYMGLFEVHVGKMAKFRSAQYNLSYRRVRDMGCDSAMGERGYNLYNDEIIVYNIAQTDIRFLVEVR